MAPSVVTGRVSLRFMCFSADVSFAAAATTGLIGAVTVGKVATLSERPLAAIPLLFSLQQAIEGCVWLALGGKHLPVSTFLLTNSYVFVALIIWPVYGPLAAALVEQNYVRRLAMMGLAALGLVVALYGAMHIVAHPFAARIVGHSIAYTNGPPHPHLRIGAYEVCACLPFVLSSYKVLRWFGVLVITGLIVSSLFYFWTRFSVWCFFAALASATLYLHFAKVPRSACSSGSNGRTREFLSRYLR
jgi:hypothetical protein